MRRIITTVIVCVALGATLNAQSAALEVTLACSWSQGDTNLTVTLHHSGASLAPEMTALSRHIRIGTLMGAWTVPSVSLAFTDLLTGATGVYRYMPYQMPGVVAGRLDPWMLVLPPGTSYSLQLSPSDFLSPEQGNRLDATTQHELVARFVVSRASDAGGAQVSETLTSEPLVMPVDCAQDTLGRRNQ